VNAHGERTDEPRDYRQEVGVPYLLPTERQCAAGCPWLATNDSPLCRRHKRRQELRHGTPVQRLQWVCEVTLDYIWIWIYDLRDLRSRRRA
jgi:hypothetical protein